MRHFLNGSNLLLIENHSIKQMLFDVKQRMKLLKRPIKHKREALKEGHVSDKYGRVFLHLRFLTSAHASTQTANKIRNTKLIDNSEVHEYIAHIHFP